MMKHKMIVPTKKVGKRRKQIARKGMHTSVDENVSDDSDKVDEQEKTNTGTETPLNPVPVAMKTPSVATYKIIKQGEKGVYQIVREDGTDIVYINFGAMLKSISRDDLTELYRIVMNRYGLDGPKDKLEKGFWKCLRIMFEEPLRVNTPGSDENRMKLYDLMYNIVNIAEESLKTNNAAKNDDKEPCNCPSRGGRTGGRSVEADLVIRVMVGLMVKATKEEIKEIVGIKTVMPSMKTSGPRGCTYKEFLACNPKEYDGKGGAIVYTCWIEKIESVQDMSGCRNNQKVKYTVVLFVGKALTWWNSQIHTQGREAVVGMSWEDFKTLTKEEFCSSNEMQKLETELWNHAMVGAGHATYTDRFHELARLVPHLVTLENKRIERVVYGLALQIRGMVAATELTTIQKAVQIVGTLTDESIRNGSIKKNIKKRGNEGEPSQDRNGRDDNKRTRTRNAFATTTNSVRRENTGTTPKCTTYNFYHTPEAPCHTCFNCNRPGYPAKDYRVVPRNVNPVNARSLAVARRACFECGGTDHYRSACPRLNRAQWLGVNRPNQALAIDGGQGRGKNGNQASGRAFMLGADEARQDPNIMTVEIDKVIKGCKLEIEGYGFDINLIPFGSETFDVIIGMDWLSNHKAKIICHEKVVRIPLPNGKVLRVVGERPEEKMRHLISAKAKEQKQEEIVVVRYFPKVFSNDLSGLPPIREIKFRIELVPRAISVAKPPYRLTPSEIEELSGQLKELQDKGFIRPNLSPWGALVLFVNKKDDGIHVEPSKIEVVKNWEAPRTPSEVRLILGLAGKTFDWGEEQERAFQTLKDKLCNAPVLALSDGPKDFVVYCDASGLGLGYVLMQKGKGDVRTLIMDEAHKSKYSIHPRANKMNYDLRDRYWWPGMKKDITVYVSRIAMDFVTKLPRTSSGHDTIWVIVDRLTKSAHFLPMRKDYKMDKLVRLYLNEIVSRHGVPISIISDRDSSFTSRFWPSMQEAEVGEGHLIGPGLVQETTEKISQIKDRLKAARDRHKIYADDRRKPLGFSVGEFVGPFEITERIGPVAYSLDLPEELDGVHDTFHVSNLKKFLADPTLKMPFDEIQVDAKLNFIEEPVKILKREFKKLKRSRIAIVKVRWNSERGPKFTWEREDQMKLKYPQLFSSVSS
ncbi:putative reverse transcriptase domain-containing protein [Tanacetum coccineum]